MVSLRSMWTNRAALSLDFLLCKPLSAEGILIQGENGSKVWGTKGQELQPH